MRIIRTRDDDFDILFQRIMNRGQVFDKFLWETVAEIVENIALRGDDALFEYTARFDGHLLNTQTAMATASEIEDAAARVGEEDLAVLTLAAGRIERYHRHQVVSGWAYTEEVGIELGQRLTPIERVAIYAPGGLAVYPSTVLMAGIPARIAGVTEIILVSPTKTGVINPLIAAAAKLCGIHRIFKIGGAQAIAALAYGTASVPRVDKIVGPGNAYVAAAKKMVFGRVAIDMIAGPSEVLIIADGRGPSSYAAADLIAQAEHDKMASAVLLTPDESFADQVLEAICKQLETLPKGEIARHSLAAYGAIFITRDMGEAVAIANRFAPEHLELMVENPREILSDIKHAGAVFLGYYTPEAMGDYLAGPNHILPTAGTARFSSPLGVYDFVKRTSILSFTEEALNRFSLSAERFAALEGLEGHGRSIAVRLNFR